MAITVPVAGNEVSVTDFGKPVADQLNALVPTAWANLTLQNSWANYQVTCRYRKVGDICYLQGCAHGGANNTVVFTLPVGFRPLVRINAIAYHWPSAPSAYFVLIETDGTFRAAMLDSKPGNPQYIDVGQIWFPLV